MTALIETKQSRRLPPDEDEAFPVANIADPVDKSLLENEEALAEELEVPASARMYDLIRNSVIIDLGRIFDKELGGYPHTLFSNPIAKNAPESFSSSYRTGEETMLERLKTNINPAFSK